MQIQMEAEKATNLKACLKSLAKGAGLDLGNSDNRYSLWVENGPQGYVCWAHASYPYEVYRLMGHYMFQGAAVLDAELDRVTLFTCEIG